MRKVLYVHATGFELWDVTRVGVHCQCKWAGLRLYVSLVGGYGGADLDADGERAQVAEPLVERALRRGRPEVRRHPHVSVVMFRAWPAGGEWKDDRGKCVINKNISRQ